MHKEITPFSFSIIWKVTKHSLNWKLLDIQKQKKRIFMRKKEGTAIIFGIILTTTFLVAFNSRSSDTRVCINPIEKTVYPHQTFIIDVDVTDVWALQAYSIMIYYQTIPIDALSVELPPGHFLEPITEKKDVNVPWAHETFRIIRREIDDNFNTTHGRVWISARLYARSKIRIPHCEAGWIRYYYDVGRTGSGTLFTITFNCTGSGRSVLCFYQTILSGTEASSIPHSRIDGLIEAHCMNTST